MAFEFDTLVDGFSQYVDTSPVVKYVEEPTLSKAIENIEGLSVMDLGCGVGFYTQKILAKNPKRVVAIDIAPNMVEGAKKYAQNAQLHPNAEFLAMDAIDLPYKNEFDLIFANQLLHYASSVQNLRQMCQKMADALKPGGRLIGFLPLANREALPLPEISRQRYQMHITGGPDIKNEDENEFIFYDKNQKEVVRAVRRWFDKETYMEAMTAAGFNPVLTRPKVSEEGIKKYGEEYWKLLVDAPLRWYYDCQKV